jgi:hypothetical protein
MKLNMVLRISFEVLLPSSVPEDFRTSTDMFEGSQASPACPSDSSSINIKMSMELWWNDTDRGRQKYWDRKPVPVLLYPTQIPHELTGDRICAFSVGDRQIAA